MQFDYVIVGGGSAGSVLANRLSAKSSHRVCLLEAGPDTPPERMPKEILEASVLPNYFEPYRYWTKLEAYMDAMGNRSFETLMATTKPRRYEQARVMGGGSTVNGQVAVRGIPLDYDEWTAMGAAGWAFKDVLPYFRRLERDMDFDGPFHGKEGPIPIHRTFPPDWGGLTLAMREASASKGIQFFPDCHAEFGDGCFPHPRSNAYGHRVSAALGYLDGATRIRPNLHIRDHAFVEALLFEGARATGLRVRRHGKSEEIHARTIIVSCGALHSPALLMRAGIGPAEELKALGIGVRADRPGVGQNLQDHPLLGLGLHLTPAGRMSPEVGHTYVMSVRWSSRQEGCAPQDMKLSISNRFSHTRMGERLGAVLFGPNKSYSKGFLKLRSANPEDEPLIAFNLFSDPRDLVRMAQAARFAHELLSMPECRSLWTDVWPGIYSDTVRSLMPKSRWNDVKSDIAAVLLDWGGVARQMVLKRAMDPRFGMADVLEDDATMNTWIREGSQGDWHACGTCRMGRPDDHMAVVDPKGRVIGIEGLHVADASVMPSVPCANPNITTIMIGEKMADHVQEGAT